MLIFTPYLNNRFRYAADQLFIHYRGVISLTDDPAVFSSHPGPKLLYGKEEHGSAFPYVSCCDRMWNDDVVDLQVSVSMENGIVRLRFNGLQSFDPFAAVFWMLTRYEEYVVKDRDHHERFVSTSSALGRHAGMIDMPWVDVWRKELGKLLIQYYPEVKLDNPPLRCVMTVDVDSAFAYRHKGFVRTAGGMAKDLFRFDFSNLYRRLITVIARSHDPYDTYDLITKHCTSHGIPLTWFFLLADKSAEDIGLSHNNRALQTVIRKVAGQYETGIHPGYASDSQSDRIQTEKGRLEGITDKVILHSRQHYLKLRFPETYRALIACGITDDYTMGYADHTGFRAGTNFKFPWFDLEKNESTALMVHPFAVMDTTLRDYMTLNPDAAIQRIHQMIASCRETGGEFTLLWHNESVSEIGKWRNWREVFLKAIPQT